MLLGLLFVETFDSNINISSPMASTLDILLTFTSGSLARGGFISLLYIDNSNGGPVVDFSHSLYYVQGRSEMTNTITGLPGGMYMALAYDVEETGEITSDRAADQQSVTITGPSTNSGKCKIIKVLIDINYPVKYTFLAFSCILYGLIFCCYFCFCYFLFLLPTPIVCWLQ